MKQKSKPGLNTFIYTIQHEVSKTIIKKGGMTSASAG